MDTSTWWTRPRFIAAASTFLAVVLALSPAVVNSRPVYNPELAVLTATLIAIIWYTVFTFELLRETRSRDERELQRERKTAATGLLYELRWLDQRLRYVFDAPPVRYGDPFEHPVLELAVSRLTLFEASTAEKIVRFRNFLNDVRVGLKNYAEASNASDKRAIWDHTRERIAQACRVIPELRDALTAEGGKITGVTVSEPEVLGLSPDPFSDVPEPAALSSALSSAGGKAAVPVARHSALNPGGTPRAGRRG